MDSPLSLSTITSIKVSYYNVLSYFLQIENGCDSKLSCLSKWGNQLGIHPTELHRLMHSSALKKFEMPTTSMDALAQVYDMVYMVYMDGIVEDIELEVVSVYATGVGLEAYVVNNILKAIVAAQLDGIPNEVLRSDIAIHPEVYV